MRRGRNESATKRCDLPDGVLFDDADLAIFAGRTLNIDGEGYCSTTVDRKKVRVHRILVETPAGYCVDHINGNKLDNRRSNLRVASYSVSLHNKLANRRSKTGVKNVYYYPPGTRAKTARYVAQITLDRRVKTLGSFPDIGAAADAVARWRADNIPDYDQRSAA